MIRLRREGVQVSAVVTDPPYELGSMGKRWDRGGVSYRPQTWRAAHCLLPEGGRLLAFAGSRTAHRITCAIEDAGFVIEDVVMWLYGSGFPKHRSKFKPAYEPIIVARKGKVSDLNIDAGRIGTGEDKDDERWYKWERGDGAHMESKGLHTPGRVAPRPDEVRGRWPANVALDEEAARMLDAQSGERRSPSDYNRSTHPECGYHGGFYGMDEGNGYGDSGGASRFFYVAKATRAEREAGLEGAPRKRGGSTVDGFTEDKANGNDRNRPVLNHHPTVKPVDLMRWLIRMVAKPGDTVLDPFMGSGTTGIAATLEGVHFIGIEREAEYVDIARRRIGQTQPSLFGGTYDDVA
jgi:DNA modification methylase